jgi:hypothetical protein
MGIAKYVEAPEIIIEQVVQGNVGVVGYNKAMISFD